MMIHFAILEHELSSVFIMCQGCQAITNQRYTPTTVTNDSKDKQNSMQEGCLPSKQVIQRAVLT